MNLRLLQSPGPAVARWRKRASHEVFAEAERLEKRAARLKAIGDVLLERELAASIRMRRTP